MAPVSQRAVLSSGYRLEERLVSSSRVEGMYDDGAVVPVEAKISPSAGSSVEPLSQHRIVRPLECLKADALDSEPLDTCSGAFLQPDVTPCLRHTALPNHR